MKKLTKQEFIERCIKIHKNKYDYSNIEYLGSFSKITLFCKIHGQFSIQCSNHLHLKQGCPKCSIETGREKKSTSVEEFIKKCSKLKEYKYENLSFKNIKEKINLICPKHGKFTTTPRNLLRNFGCKYCKIEKSRRSQEEFIDLANKIHNKKYSYNNCSYISSHELINVICPIHGEFSIKPYWHLAGGGCQSCSYGISSNEREIYDFLIEIGIKNITQKFREKGKLEIDIYCPDQKIGIEFNGIYWHSDIFKDRYYHINKTSSYKEIGIKIIHIFEDEWINKKDICKSRLKSIFNILDHKIYARKCIIKSISDKEAKNFLKHNHIQGYCRSKIRLGLFYNNKLVSIMTFGKYRLCTGRKNILNEYELLRYCSVLNTNIPGAASKLLKYFIKNYNPKKIISYADIRWSDGNLYYKLGFIYKKDTKPGYFYYKNGIRYNRFRFRKNKLIENGEDCNMSESEIMKKNGYNKIWDCGNILYEMNL